MSDGGVEMFDIAFERPAFRRGKLRGGAIGSRRRGGNHTCMGRCMWCSISTSKTSRVHIRNRQDNWSKKLCEMDFVVSGRCTMVERYNSKNNVVVTTR